MDRSLQSALEKRSRIGTWQSRVYRIERGYLSTWPDVAAVTAKKDPTHTECLFQETKVAVVTDQGDRRFRIEFPWDSSSTLSLRASDVAMKKSWVDILTATVREAASQIEGTGSVFAYGGMSQHQADESYEEAAYLSTNRFLAAHVVEASSRASYVNDRLNELFEQRGSASRGREAAATRACAGADAVIDEVLALMEDFREEVHALQELRRGGRDDGLGGLDPCVAAPRVRRFCDEYLTLTGRLATSRLMLELSPFMDSTVAGTSSAPTSSTRAGLVSTRKKLDEMYASAQRLSVTGSRSWLMDIREGFLDAEGLLSASSSAPEPSTYSSAKATPASSDRSAVLSFAMAPFTSSSARSPAEEEVSDSGAGGLAASFSSSLAGISIGAFRRGSRTQQERGKSSFSIESLAASLSQLGASSREESETPTDGGGGSSEQAVPDGPPSASFPGVDSPSPGTRAGGGRGDAASASPALKPQDGGAVADTGARDSPDPSPPRAPAVQPTPPVQGGADGRRGRRAFARGLWNAGGSSAGRPRPVEEPDASESSPEALSKPGEGGDGDSGAVAVVPPTPERAATASTGRRRRFAGGAMGVPPRSPRRAQAENPFGGEAQGDSLRGGNAQDDNPFASKSRDENPFGGKAGDDAPTGGEARVGISSVENGSGVGVSSGGNPDGSPKPVPTWGTSSAADEKRLPAWASGNDPTPDWASDAGADPSRLGGASSRVDLGLAPPSQPDEVSEAIARKSPLMAPREDVTVSRPKQLRRPGGAARRAFGGGQSVF